MLSGKAGHRASERQSSVHDSPTGPDTGASRVAARPLPMQTKLGGPIGRRLGVLKIGAEAPWGLSDCCGASLSGSRILDATGDCWPDGVARRATPAWWLAWCRPRRRQARGKRRRRRAAQREARPSRCGSGKKACRRWAGGQPMTSARVWLTARLRPSDDRSHLAFTFCRAAGLQTTLLIPSSRRAAVLASPMPVARLRIRTAAELPCDCPTIRISPRRPLSSGAHWLSQQIAGGVTSSRGRYLFPSLSPTAPLLSNSTQAPDQPSPAWKRRLHPREKLRLARPPAAPGPTTGDSSPPVARQWHLRSPRRAWTNHGRGNGVRLRWSSISVAPPSSGEDPLYTSAP